MAMTWPWILVPKVMCDGPIRLGVILAGMGEHPSGTKEDWGIWRKSREDEHSYMHGGLVDSHWFEEIEGRRRRLLGEGTSVQTLHALQTPPEWIILSIHNVPKAIVHLNRCAPEYSWLVHVMLWVCTFPLELEMASFELGASARTIEFFRQASLSGWHNDLQRIGKAA